MNLLFLEQSTIEMVGTVQISTKIHKQNSQRELGYMALNPYKAQIPLMTLKCYLITWNGCIKMPVVR